MIRRFVAPLALVGAFLLGMFVANPGGWPLAAQADVRYFPETQHTVRGLFLKYWNEHGALAQQGYPLTEEFQEKSTLDGKTYTVQYFERAIFENHPENKGTPYEVLLAQLGKYQIDSRYPNASNPAAAPVAPPAGGNPTPAPAPPTQPPASGGQTYTGTGQQAVPNVTLKAGLAVFHLTGPPSGYFGVKLLDSDGKLVDLLANTTTANFTGAHALRAATAGNYVLQVDATGGWTITVDQPSATSAVAPAPWSGHGHDVTGLFTLKAGLATFQVRNTGSGYFGVKLLDSQGKLVDLLANSTDPNFSGSKAVRITTAGAYVITVDSEGDWQISVTQ